MAVRFPMKGTTNTHTKKKNKEKLASFDVARHLVCPDLKGLG